MICSCWSDFKIVNCHLKIFLIRFQFGVPHLRIWRDQAMVPAMLISVSSSSSLGFPFTFFFPFLFSLLLSLSPLHRAASTFSLNFLSQSRKEFRKGQQGQNEKLGSGYFRLLWRRSPKALIAVKPSLWPIVYPFAGFVELPANMIFPSLVAGKNVVARFLRKHPGKHLFSRQHSRVRKTLFSFCSDFITPFPLFTYSLDSLLLHSMFFLLCFFYFYPLSSSSLLLYFLFYFHTLLFLSIFSHY